MTAQGHHVERNRPRDTAPVRRRRLLTAAACLPAIALFSHLRPAGSAGACQTALSALDDPGRAAGLGRACLAALPVRPTSADQLARTILGDDATNRGMPDLDPAATRVSLRARIRREFAQGAVIGADGWILSLTEARLYALAAMVAHR